MRIHPEIPDLVACLETAMLTKFAADDRREELHISDLGHALPGEGCLRQLWLRLRGAERRDPSIGEMFMWDQGHALQRRCDDYLGPELVGSGWALESWEREIRFSFTGGPIWRGRIDRMLKHRESGTEYVLDYKTSRGRAFAHLDAEGPKPSHVIQVQGYVRAMGTVGGMLLYADREGQNGFRQFPVPRDDRAVQSAAQAIQEAVVLSEPGPGILEPVVKPNKCQKWTSLKVSEPWQCSYCPYRDVACPGAMTRAEREAANGVSGKVLPDGSLEIAAGKEALGPALEEWVHNHGGEL